MLKKLLKLSPLFLLFPFFVLAQSGSISGVVTDAETGETVPGVNVIISQLTIGDATNVDGEYTINKVPAGTWTLEAKFVGFRTFTTTVQVGTNNLDLDIQLEPDVFGLDEVVVTGVASETSKEKLTVSVSRLGPEALSKVPAVSAASSLAGKVAGANVVSGSGQPGSGTSINLRGATSITGDNQPLFIVDGVILGSSQVDMESMDIESIEVIKGASAASLYGSRAQNGVIQIRTKRGQNLSLNQTRITLRNEFGRNFLPKTPDLSQSHQWRTDGTDFLDANGNAVAFAAAAEDDVNAGDPTQSSIVFQDNEFPGETFDHFDQFFDPGYYYTNYLSIGQNTPSTNFFASFNNLKESGVIGALDGYSRQSLRLNLDHDLRDDFALSMSTFYSVSDNDDPTAPGSPNPFFGLMFMNPNADLNQIDPNTGFPVLQPDPRTLEENPIYNITVVETSRQRERIQGALNLRYSPLNWIDLEGNMSYDQSNRFTENYRPVGYATIDAGSADGLDRNNAEQTAVNSSVTATFRRTFDDLTTGLKLRVLSENETFNSTYAEGATFAAAGTKDLSLTDPNSAQVASSSSEINSVGYFAIANFDLKDRYLLDALVRRDGSSLFGADERWHTYFRVSGAWRLSQEDFWTFDDTINEFKLRAAYGTAGRRPGFSNQYETYSVSGGTITPIQLGNPDLKPETTTELEVALDLTVMERYTVELAYSQQTVEDQLLNVPLLAFNGFSSQFQNAGTVEANTIEASVNAALLRTRDMTWNLGVVFDKTTQEITEFNIPAYRTALGTGYTAFYNREGETFGALYGDKWITGSSELPADVQQYSDQFNVNDDGYLVAVGSGNSWRDGISSDLWGTTVDVDGDGSGDYNWGMPIKFVDEDGNSFTKVGSVVPDFSLGLNTNFRYKGFSLYMVWSAQVGGDIYNGTRQWPYRDLRHGDIDQAGKSDATKKPTTYYSALYNVNSISSHFVEDGDYVKLRELSFDYTMDQRTLTNFFGEGLGNALNSVSFSVIGRNLLVFSDYSGFDPEVGGGANASLARVDSFDYPNFRTISGKIEIQF